MNLEDVRKPGTPGSEQGRLFEPTSESKPDERNETRPEPNAEPQADPKRAEDPDRDLTPAKAVAEATAEWEIDAPSEAAVADLEPPPQPTPPAPPVCLALAGWLEAAAATHPGKLRSGNEDRFLLKVWAAATRATW